ncbi:hypothetical protein GCM10009416_00320 [Craurococcus roseus]|uniref:Uncharacterized protein n=1 Tax=Craurococcus roseus TaxID=77585 RepID=A0ABN1EGQ5_9PROT
MQEDMRRTQAATTGGGGTGQASAPGDALREAGSELRSKTAEAGARAGEAASRLRDEAAGAAADVKAEVSGVAGAVQDRAAGFAEEQKRAGADQAEGLARAVHRAADELQSSSPQLAHYVREAADSTGQLAEALRSRSVGDLVSGVEEFARRQPVAFFGATVLAGFALARFVKSSADDARGTGGAHTAHGRAASGHHVRSGGGAAPTLGTSTAGAPGWVPASGGADGADPTTRRPATTAAASLGGAAAHHAGTSQPGPGRSS